VVYWPDGFGRTWFCTVVAAPEAVFAAKIPSTPSMIVLGKFFKSSAGVLVLLDGSMLAISGYGGE